jgi:hypothetical protein
MVGTLYALNEWHLSRGQVIAVVCLATGMLMLGVATLLWLITGPEKTASAVMEGLVVLATAAGLLLVLWGLGNCVSHRLTRGRADSLEELPFLTLKSS